MLQLIGQLREAREVTLVVAENGSRGREGFGPLLLHVIVAASSILFSYPFV